MELILASSSPRRKQLLSEYGFNFTVVTSDYSETAVFDSPEKTVETFALGKAKDVFNNTKGNRAVLGADTIVVMDGKILGKPKDKADAIKTLRELSGKTHSVLTGYALIREGKTLIGHVKTDVTFNTLSSELISEYVDTGLPLDKAGSYGIQDGFNLVEKFDGSFYNVVGLPIDIIEKTIKEFIK
jgi:septum formation protein